MSAPHSHRRSEFAAALAVAMLLAPSLFATHARAAAPQIGAPSAILIEPSTREIVFSRQPAHRRAIASATKMMTALVTLDRARLSDTFVTVPYSGLAVESTAGFRGGERVKVRDLLRALLVASANDAAQTLAIRVGGSTEGFVAMMNARARKLGLTNTHFANPIGLDAPGNYSSATDLVKMALLLRTNAFIRDTIDRPKVTLQSGSTTRTLANRNTLIANVPFMNGVKTGHTQRAGYVLVGSATRNGVTLVSAVLGTGSESSRNADTLALMRYGFEHYESVVAVKARTVYAQAEVKDGGESIDLVAQKTITRTVRRGQKLTTTAIVPAELTAPVAAGSRAGTLNVIYRGRVVDRVALVTTTAVAAPAAGGGGDLIVRLGGAALVGLIAVTILVLRWRRAKRQRRAGADSEARIA